MDLISRQAAINAVESLDWYHINPKGEMISGANSTEHQPWYKADDIYKVLEELPSAQPTLYGYKIEHLAYIARIMENEGATAEYAVRTFDAMERAINMFIDEARDIVERSMFNGFNKPTGGD